MKIYLNPIDAYNDILKHMNTGKERIINDTLHFGVGNTVYCYKEDAPHGKGYFKPSKNTLFVHLSDIGLKYFLDNQPSLIQS